MRFRSETPQGRLRDLVVLLGRAASYGDRTDHLAALLLPDRSTTAQQAEAGGGERRDPRRVRRLSGQINGGSTEGPCRARLDRHERDRRRTVAIHALRRLLLTAGVDHEDEHRRDSLLALLDVPHPGADELVRLGQAHRVHLHRAAVGRRLGCRRAVREDLARGGTGDQRTAVPEGATSTEALAVGGSWFRALVVHVTLRLAIGRPVPAPCGQSSRWCRPPPGPHARNGGRAAGASARRYG